jgi:hypothetical protein
MNSNLVTIKANKLASRRTRNRIHEHGPEFIVRNRANNVFGFKGVDCILLTSPKDEWFGWVPENEIDILSH